MNNALHILVAAALYTPIDELIQHAQDSLRQYKDSKTATNQLIVRQHNAMLSIRFEHEGKPFSEVIKCVEANVLLAQTLQGEKKASLN